MDAKLVFWSENGEFLAIATDDGCFILKFDRDVRLVIFGCYCLYHNSSASKSNVLLLLSDVAFVLFVMFEFSACSVNLKIMVL